jgi:hypothetical protein
MNGARRELLCVRWLPDPSGGVSLTRGADALRLQPQGEEAEGQPWDGQPPDDRDDGQQAESGSVPHTAPKLDISGLA